MIDFTTKLGIIQIDIWAIVISLLNLLILFLLVKKFLFKPVKKILDQRKAAVESVYAEAEDANRAAQEDKRYYEEKRLHATEEAEDILARASANAKKNGEEIVREAHEQAAAVKAKASKDIEQEKLKAINDAKNEIAEISVQIAEKIVERELDDRDHKEFVDRFVRDLDGR